MHKLALAAATIVAGGAVHAEPSREAKAFGAREFIEDISLSTDGSKVAMIQPDDARGARLVIADLSSGSTKTILGSTGTPDRLRYCRWTAATRLVCGASFQQVENGTPVTYTRMIAINAEGTGLKLLSPRSSMRALSNEYYGGDVIDWTGNSQDGSILMMRAHTEQETIGTNIRSDTQGIGVDQVNTISLARKMIETPKSDAVEFMTDGLGNVRLMGILGESSNGYVRNAITYSYRRKNAKDWERLGRFRIDIQTAAGFEPVAIDPALDVLYGFDDVEGRKALYRIALDGSMSRQLVLARPDVDVDRVIRIGRQQRVVGVSWAAEQREVEFFDPELKKLSASLAKALPKQPIVRFVDASTDERQLLLDAGSDDNPGRYYVFDKASHKLAEVLPARPQLEGIPLAHMRPITYRASDGTMIPAYLTLPANGNGRNLPAIVMPHGGPGARDEWGFDWLAQFFAARGYAVLQPNFRGSTGYGEAWFQKNGFQSWKTAVGDVNDSGKWLISSGIAASDKLAIVGWSYGGYAALQSAALDPDLFNAIVAIAPVTDLDALRGEARGYANFPIVDRYIGNGAHVRDGSPARNAARIKSPVLLFHGDLDRNVGVAESRLMADRLRDVGKKVEYIEFKGLDHQLEDSRSRAEMLDKADMFLRAAMKM